MEDCGRKSQRDFPTGVCSTYSVGLKTGGDAAQ